MAFGSGLLTFQSDLLIQDVMGYEFAFWVKKTERGRWLSALAGVSAGVLLTSLELLCSHSTVPAEQLLAQITFLCVISELK